ncbi:NAD-dependent epimerase/dehydratase family protein [Cohnella sp. REN36]|uniref:NAD-dependent epimerase/dehydratase family protein n=1 Tax=Cohnella sp. REN36 TaxID=2887347 RepID=UPI001D134BBF|nr:NAD-dependent epimerase/dehydratase family protein [Cohnella sp. REN36]MCC3374096.1 NAD-dependent epimerase/dehydratase family protein [Cohnella sp. REN36]
MRVLVTGGAGFIASHIVDELVLQKYEVHVVDDLSTGKRENLNENSIFHNINIHDDRFEEMFARVSPDIVIHHAAQVSVSHSMIWPVEDAKINMIGSINVIECCKKYKVRKIIYASSAAVYGVPVSLPIQETHEIRPLSPYGISKYTPEEYLRICTTHSEVDYTILRYANVYGQRQDPKGEGGVVSIFMDRFLTGHAPSIYGDGAQTRDFIYVKDVVAANLQALTSGSRNTFNIGTGTTTSINELVTILNKIFQTNITPQYYSPRLGDITHSVLCNQKAEQELGWKSKYSIFEGLNETYRAIQKQSNSQLMIG